MSQPPLRADAQRNLTRIIAAGNELFARHGLDITLDDVAKEAGVGVGTVYRRFNNKHELIDALFEQSLNELLHTAECALHQPDPWDGFVHLTEVACQRMAVNRGLAEVVIGRENGLEKLAAASKRMHTAFNAVFERAHKAQKLRPDAALGDVFATIHMVASFAEFANPVAPQSWRRYHALMLDALRPHDQHLPLPEAALTDEQVRMAREHHHRR